jgi:hypothetical protein
MASRKRRVREQAEGKSTHKAGMSQEPPRSLLKGGVAVEQAPLPGAALPPDLLLLVVRACSSQALLRLGSVCRFLFHACEAQWRALFARERKGMWLLIGGMSWASSWKHRFFCSSQFAAGLSLKEVLRGSGRGNLVLLCPGDYVVEESPGQPLVLERETEIGVEGVRR